MATPLLEFMNLTIIRSGGIHFEWLINHEIRILLFLNSFTREKDRFYLQASILLFEQLGSVPHSILNKLLSCQDHFDTDVRKLPLSYFPFWKQLQHNTAETLLQSRRYSVYFKDFKKNYFHKKEGFGWTSITPTYLIIVIFSPHTQSLV